MANLAGTDYNADAKDAVTMTQHHQNRKYADCSASSQRVIAEVLSDIENNLAEPFRACEDLESRRMSIKEAAEYVGIYDLNCFSRLFKKIIVCSPNKI